MAVVPGHELRRGVAALQVLAANAHAAIGLRARRVDDLVIVTPEIRHAHVAAELDAAEEAKARMRRDLVEGAGDRLDLLVIGRDAGTDEAVRCGHAIEQVDLDDDVLLLEEVIGGIEAGGAGTDDSNSEWAIVRSGAGHGPAPILALLDGDGAPRP